MRAPSITLVAMLAILAPAARADNDQGRVPAKALELAETGRALHSVGVYDGAVTAFTEAYVLAPHPSLLYNIAQSYRLSGNCDESAWMYRRFLQTRPIGEQRRAATAHLTALGNCGTGDLRITADEPRALRLKRIGVALTIGGGVSLVTALALHAHEGATPVAGRDSSTIPTVLAIGGGLAVASGVAMYVLGRRYERAGSPVVAPTANGAQVTVSWGF